MCRIGSNRPHRRQALLLRLHLLLVHSIHRSNQAWIGIRRHRHRHRRPTCLRCLRRPTTHPPAVSAGATENRIPSAIVASVYASMIARPFHVHNFISIEYFCRNNNVFIFPSRFTWRSSSMSAWILITTSIERIVSYCWMSLAWASTSTVIPPPLA